VVVIRIQSVWFAGDPGHCRSSEQPFRARHSGKANATDVPEILRKSVWFEGVGARSGGFADWLLLPRREGEAGRD
jgi:hypothetical protein